MGMWGIWLGGVLRGGLEGRGGGGGVVLGEGRGMPAVWRVE